MTRSKTRAGKSAPVEKPGKPSETSFNPEMHIDPIKFEITFDGQPPHRNRTRHLFVEVRDGFKGRRWCIKLMEGMGWVLNKQGEFEWEPTPSGRADKFIDRTRFKSVADAVDLIEKHKGMILQHLEVAGAGQAPLLKVG